MCKPTLHFDYRKSILSTPRFDPQPMSQASIVDRPDQAGGRPIRAGSQSPPEVTIPTFEEFAVPTKHRDDSKGSQPDKYPGTIEKRKLADLVWNSRQDENFHPLSDTDLARLADDMQLNGQREPIEIVPDGRIIDGHQRFRAAQRNGRADVLVRVRHDLAGDEGAIERRMIEANLTRRQLDGLDRVRLARRLEEIGRGVKPGGLDQGAQQDLRDRVGEALGMSGRNVQRYLNVLGAPMAVQRAYSSGALSLKLAEKVARLKGPAQVEIAGAIAAGGNPTEVVSMHLPAATPAENDPDREYEVFLKSAAQAVGALDDRAERVRGGPDLDREIEVLERAGALLVRLIDRLDFVRENRAQECEDYETSVT